MSDTYDYTKMHLHPGNYFRSMKEKDCMDYMFIAPVGRYFNNEMSDVHYIKDAFVPYHVHSRGYETFCIDRGSVRVTVCGKQCIAHTGDMIQIQPHMPHGFTMLEEGTIWRELFLEMDMNNGLTEKKFLEHSFPEKLDDPDFMAEYRLTRGTVRLGEPLPELITKAEMPQIRVKGSALVRFNMGGVTGNLKAGRWEFGGKKEVWEFVFGKPCAICWDYPHSNWDLFVVLNGRVRVEAAGQCFTAAPRDIINIPPYTEHKLTVLDENTVLQANNVQSLLLRALEDIEILEAAKPGAIEDWGAVQPILHKYGCAVTAITKL